MASNKTEHDQSFCVSLVWVWNYWMLHFWISMMDKGTEHALRQFTGGTRWKGVLVHCRSKVLKWSWQVGEVVWNYVQQEQVQSTTPHTFRTIRWGKPPHQEFSEMELKAAAVQGLSSTALLQKSPTAALAAWVVAQSERCQVLPSLYLTAVYLHRMGRKVTSDQGKKYQQNLQEKIACSRLVYLRCGNVKSSISTSRVTMRYPYLQQKSQKISYLNCKETEKTWVRCQNHPAHENGVNWGGSMTGDAENRSKKQPVRITLAVLQPQGNGTDDFFFKSFTVQWIYDCEQRHFNQIAPIWEVFISGLYLLLLQKDKKTLCFKYFYNT